MRKADTYSLKSARELLAGVTFEIVFGRFVVHASWSRIAADYNLLRGGLLPIGLLVLTAAPLIATRIRSIS